MLRTITLSKSAFKFGDNISKKVCDCLLTNFSNIQSKPGKTLIFQKNFLFCFLFYFYSLKQKLYSQLSEKRQHRLRYCVIAKMTNVFGEEVTVFLPFFFSIE